MYSLSDYLWMIADDARVAAYAGALRACVEPGMRVLDVGAGFGFFSIVAAQAGAAHVDAVETNPAIHLGPRVAAANRCAGRIAFHHCDVRQLVLEQPADLLVLDLRGPTSFGGRSLELVIDARNRLLRPGGRIIAAADKIFAAPVRTPAVFRREVHAAHGQQGIDLTAVEQIVFDTPMRCVIAEADLLNGPRQWVSIDYQRVDSTSASGRLEWRFDDPSTLDGLGMWFEADLGGGFRFSSGPGGSVTAYRQQFVPFREPIAVAAGETFRVDLSVREARENNIWAWRGWIVDAAGERLVVDQNSLAEVVLDPGTLAQTAADARPSLGPRGRAVVAMLARLDGDHTVSVLAAQLAEEAPELFANPAAAQDFVATWVQRAAQLERGEEW